MYSKAELAIAAIAIRRIAQKEGVSESQVRADMYNAMNQAHNNNDPRVKAQWTTFHYTGQEPTIEEFILWAAGRAQEERDKWQ